MGSGHAQYKDDHSDDVARVAKHGKRMTLPLIYTGLNIYY
jgi:hypothetical protein